MSPTEATQLQAIYQLAITHARHTEVTHLGPEAREAHAMTEGYQGAMEQIAQRLEQAFPWLIQAKQGSKTT